MRELGVICARLGSARVPTKALAVVGACTLFEHAERAAAESRRLERVLCASNLPPWGMPTRIADGPLIGALQWALDQVVAEYDVVVTLQACIPFRTGAHIDATIEMLDRCGLDSAQTVVNVGWDAAPVWKPNGAVYATRTAWVRQGRIIGPRHGCLAMTPAESVNVDSAWDLRVARGVCTSSS